LPRHGIFSVKQFSNTCAQHLRQKSTRKRHFMGGLLKMFKNDQDVNSPVLSPRPSPWKTRDPFNTKSCLGCHNPPAQRFQSPCTLKSAQLPPRFQLCPPCPGLGNETVPQLSRKQQLCVGSASVLCTWKCADHQAYHDVISKDLNSSPSKSLSLRLTLGRSLLLS
jgi:hypothetical protein